MIKKTLLNLLLAIALTAGGTCRVWAAYPIKTHILRSTYFVEHNEKKLAIRLNLEYPEQNSDIRKILIERLFGYKNDDMNQAITHYLSKYRNCKKSTKVPYYLHNKYREGGVIEFNSTIWNNSHITTETEFHNMADNFVPITYRSITLSQAVSLSDDGTSMFTYDLSINRLLNVTDVFTKEGIEQLGICGDTQNEDIVVNPYDNRIVYSVMENGKKEIHKLSITDNDNMLTDKIKALVPGIRKYIEQEKENIMKRKIEEKERAEKERQYRKVLNKERYQKSNRKMKDLYLYLLDDTCYVSGIHKDIMTMTDEEIDRLASNKGCEYIARDIRDAKQFIKNGNIHFTDNDTKIIYEDNECDFSTIPPVDLSSYLMKIPPSGVSLYDHSNIIYFIDEEGNVRMPVANASNYNSAFDKFHVSKIRALQKWIPGMKEGKHVKALQSSNLSVTFSK